MGNATGLPFLPPQLFTSTGLVAAGYQLFVYNAGSTQKVNTYTDVDLTTPNTNPIILDSAGRCTIFLAPASYKFVLAPPTDTDPPSSPEWTRDNQSALSSFNVNIDVQATFGENVTARQCVYLNDGSGGFTAGTWRLTSSSANPYQSSSASTIGFVVTNTLLGQVGAVRILGRMEGFTGLTAGAVYYISSTDGAIVSSVPTLTRAVAQADTTTSIVISEWLADPVAKVDVYTTPGAATWTKNPRANTVQVFAIGGGAGGGSGRKGLAATARVGGGGGGGGAVSLLTIQASQLTATVAVTVGAGGTGGAAQATNSTNGVNGTNGVASSFGAYLFADGGTLGGGGGSGAGGAGGNGGTFAFIGGPGSTGDVAGGAGVGGLGSVASNLGAGGGASGGGITVGNAASAGGAGAAGARGSSTSSGGTSGAIGVAGGNGTAAPVNSAIGGGAGGGGGSSIAANGGAGGNGALYGGAGGGGGAAVDATGNSGKGGDGAAGMVIVTQY